MTDNQTDQPAIQPSLGAVPSPQASGPETDFGYRRVPAAAKKPMVRAVFDSVAPRYDVMNDLMSLGIHRVWKSIFATRMRPSPAKTLLDLASGTGDIATSWLRRGGGPVFLTDINAAMLSGGRDRAIGRGIVAPFTYTVADAEMLPFPNGCVDTVSIAFGLRNCTDKPAVLREARRVLKPGGRFFCLEFSRLQVAVLDPLYDRWSFDVLPRGGQAGRRRQRELPLPRREHPHLSRPGEPGVDDGAGRAGTGRLREPVGRYRRHPLGMAALTPKCIHSGWRL